MGLHLIDQPLDEQQAATDPALVAPQALRDGRLGKSVFAIERADQPPFFELSQAMPTKKNGHLEFGLGDIDVTMAHLELWPMQPSSGMQALETINDLDPIAVAEHHKRTELTMPIERASHRFDRLRLAQAKRREPLVEIVDGDHDLLTVGRCHERDPNTTAWSQKMPARDTVQNQPRY